ncbi:polyprenol monophosphomannose synthase [soil metagenome]
MRINKLLIYVTTYNEADNVRPLLNRIEALSLGADLLVVDDNSPDGTSDVVTEMAQTLPHLHLIKRPGKLGIGTAHLDALAYAREQGYSTVISLDADFTHTPEYIPDFIAASGGYGLVVGSRFHSEKSLGEWSMWRILITRFGHFLTKSLLKVPYDCTGAFRAYCLDRIPAECWQELTSRDYEFFFESLTVLHSAGVPINEVPVILPGRAAGASKMRPSHALRGVFRLFAISFRLSDLSSRLNPPPSPAAAPELSPLADVGATAEPAGNTYMEAK